MARDLPTGIRRLADGKYEAYVWVRDPLRPKGGYQAAKRFPAETSWTVMKQWRLRRTVGIPPEDADRSAPTFAEDAREYLAREKVKHMPTSDERGRHIRQWIAIFGARQRRDIQPQEIQAALDAMRRCAWQRGQQTGVGLSAGSINKRRMALMDLWTTLDGRHQANPVKATTIFAEPVPEPRAPPLTLVLTILRRLRPTKSRARLKVIAWTGWPHAIVKQLTPIDLDLKAGRAFVRRRRKGKGARARWLPLLPEAILALREFHARNAYGWFSNSSLHKRVTAFCRQRGLPRVRPYDFRHFFGTLIATSTRDERAVQELMLLSTTVQARRYTEAATDPRVEAAIAEATTKLPMLRKAANRINRVSLSRGASQRTMDASLLTEKPSRKRPRS